MAMTCKDLNQVTAGWLGEEPTERLTKYKVVGDRVEQVHTVTVHEFVMSDVEDPDLYAAMPLLEWQQSEVGKWVMEHAAETPLWHKVVDPFTFGWKVYIVARLQGADYTFYQLKWGTK